ncbi:MAG: DUF131 domain-containing protein [Ignisphaera sp.]
MSIIPIIFMVLLATAFALILLGFLLIFIESLRGYRGEEKKVEGGAVVIIGPIPFVFGTNKEVSKILVILAIVLTIVVAITFIVLNQLLAPS